MAGFRVLSSAEQVAAHLRGELASGAWRAEMPGAAALAGESGHPERRFLRTLGEAGLEVGDYHFPLWKDRCEDFHRCLESLFKNTPPTALLVQESLLFAAVQRDARGRARVEVLSGISPRVELAKPVASAFGPKLGFSLPLGRHAGGMWHA